MPAETVVFTLRRIARVQKVQALRHVGIGLLLAWTGAGSLLDGHHASWVDVVAIVAGLLLLGAFVREQRHATGAHAAHGHRIGWVDVFAAAVTLVEAWHLAHLGKRGLPFAYLLLAVLLLLIGLFHGRIQAARRLIVDDHGFDVRLMPWRRIRASWTDIASISAEHGIVSLVRANGHQERLDLTDSPERDRVIDTWLRYAPMPPRIEAREDLVTDPDLEALSTVPSGATEPSDKSDGYE
ncbi:MAG TPA: hypothetical protein VMF13_01225 [Luteitalea sp.]|nr:hypothetical protein [Luteitalea sp.]